jgi:hypothetical protein
MLPQTAAQDVFVAMPLLTHLVIRRPLAGQGAQTLAAVRLDMLHSLNVRMDLSHAWFLQGCTQLKALTVFTADVKGVSAIAHLTGLTQLELCSYHSRREAFSGEEQSELGSALAALSNLQSLCISHAPPGAVAQAHPAQLCQAYIPRYHLSTTCSQHSPAQVAAPDTECEPAATEAE